MPGLVTPALFAFLRDLAAHNDRSWFHAEKSRFERDVKAPFHALVRALGAPLAAIDPNVRADDGSVFRIYRDTRFAKDKAPYKTHVAAQFPYGAVRGPSGAGYYLHLEPGDCFFVGGVHLPEPSVASRIRRILAERPDAWAAAKASAGPLGEGPTLARVPKPWAADHPLADDLRRKSFTAWRRFSEDDVTRSDFLDRLVEAASGLAPLVRLVAPAAIAPG